MGRVLKLLAALLLLASCEHAFAYSCAGVYSSITNATSACETQRAAWGGGYSCAYNDGNAVFAGGACSTATGGSYRTLYHGGQTYVFGWRACTAGETVVNGKCETAQPTCPANATYTNGSCVCDSGYTMSGGSCVPRCQPKTGKWTFLAVASDESAPNPACIDGCEASFDGTLGVEMACGGPGACAGSHSADYHYTGSSCAVANNATEVPVQVLPDATAGRCATDGTNSGCISETKQNCGYWNQEYRCVNAQQLTDANPCVQTGSGGVFCKQDAPNKPLAPVDVNGNALPPDGTMTLATPGTSTSTVVNYWSGSTVINGASENGEDAPGDKGRGDCGSENTPCHVVVDGEGTGGGGGGNGDGSGDGNCLGDNCGVGLPAFGGGAHALGEVGGPP